MKNKFKDKVVSIFLAMLLIVSTFAVTGYALTDELSTDDNHSFSFKIPANQNQGRYTSGKFRSTTDHNNAWKVNFKTSNEPGTGNTYTKFSICLNDGTLASSWHTVQESSGAHYYAGNDWGDYITVYLHGKDNNNIASSYPVSGYWDEETGVAPA